MSEGREPWRERITLDHWMAGVPTTSLWFWPRLVAYLIIAFTIFAFALITARNAINGTLFVLTWRNWAMAVALPPIMLLSMAFCALCRIAWRRLNRWLRHQR